MDDFDRPPTESERSRRVVNRFFTEFLALAAIDRRDVFEAAAEAFDTLSTYIEKDFWVCFALDLLYNGLPQGHPRLLFKGGTSLSKAYRLIQRFSEDVDLVVFKEDLGFSGEKDPSSLTISNKCRRRLAEDLKKEASTYILGRLKKDLSQTIALIAPDVRVVAAKDDRDGSTLLFQYPSLFPHENTAYVQPRVKLEGGARSALDPHQMRIVKPYIAKILSDWDFSVGNILTIDPQRTFWDKIMILHGWSCGYRDEQRLPDDRQRLSRHYYDVAAIYQDEIGKTAIENTALREDVLRYTKLLFNRGWMKLDEAVPCSLRLVPQGDLRKALKRDYLAMQGMILDNAPAFPDILAAISALEIEVNRLP